MSIATITVLHPVSAQPHGVRPFGLSERELVAELRRCRAAGWQRWELLVRFGRAA